MKVNANVQALFDEASALFGQLRPLSQSESPRLPNNHMEDTSFLDPGWTIHQRKISEPDVFAALYEDLSRTDSGQNNSDMFVNMETGGGRDVPLFTDERSTDLYDFVPYHGITSAMYQHQPMTTSTLDGYISSDSSISYEFLNADEPLAHSNLPHRGEYSSSPPTFFAEDSEKSPSSTKKSRFSLGKKRPSTGSLTEEFSAVKIDPLASDNFKSRKRAETVASTSSVKIVFESTSSNDVKAIVKTTQHKSFWPKNYRVGSNAKKVNSTHLDSTEKNSKKQSSASYPPSSNGLPTYIPLISFMHQPQRAHRHASLKKKTEQTPTLKAGGNPGLQSNQMVPGELTGDHLDPNESREQDRFRTSPEIDYQHTMGNNTTPQVYIRPPHNQGDNHASLINGSTPWTSPNTSIPNPIIARLRLHARSNLGCIKYMSFSALISYSNDCFSNMRMYSENKDYANAYTHGIQGMIIVTNVLPHHHECRPETGAAYFNYIAAVEMIRYRYKEMLKSLQNKIEQEYRTM
ncbi:hypothetical protein BC943DRAFT_21454 [Umbelopsis sp. AD052]|nr:hypothetical protein BC943DRAFT_21454 [Umbelopsis sp. AD052]